MKSTDIGRASDLLSELTKVDELDNVLAHDGLTRLTVRSGAGNAEVMYETKTLKTVLLKTADQWRSKVEAEIAALGVDIVSQEEVN